MGGILLVALGLRLWLLDRDELWFDEAFAALVALEPIGRIAPELSRDSSPPLYFVLLRGWAQAFGSDPWTLRLFSVLTGVLAVGTLSLLARRLWDTGTGLAASALLAVSPLHVYYSQEVRPYTLFLLFVLLSFVALDALERRGRAIDLALYCATTLAAIYTHNYGLFLPGALALSVAWGRVPFRPALFATLALFVGYLPWLPVLATQIASGATRWVERLWAATPPALALPKSLAVFSIGGWSPDYVPLGSGELPAAVHGIAYATFALLAWRALFRHRAGAARRVAAAMLVLLGLPFVLSFIWPLYLVGRHDLVALPLFLLLAARGATGLPPRYRTVVALVVGVLAAAGLGSYYDRPTAARAPGQAALLLDHAGPDDPILCTGFTRNTLEYYVWLGGGEQRFYSFPTSFGSHRGWVDERELADPRFLDADADRLTRSILADLPDSSQLWIAHSRELAGANEVLMRHVEKRWQQERCPADAERWGFTCWQRRR